MIAFLSGKPLMTATTSAIICHGVGYGVTVTSSTRTAIQHLDTAELFIHAHIKEDAFDLYGFITEDEKILFLKLLAVDGVGPKTAMGIMDKGVMEIIRAVREADVSFFQSVSRVGKKSAQKIIIELKGKLGGEELSLQEPEGKAKEVVEALVSLGFSESQSQKIVHDIDIENMRIEDAVRQSIKLLTQKTTV